LFSLQIDFRKLDKDEAFTNHIVDQLVGKHSYLRRPTLLLPPIFQFLGALFAMKMFPDVRKREKEN
jgi:hypothetical protein